MVNDVKIESPDAETPPHRAPIPTIGVIVLDEEDRFTDNMLECYALSQTVKLLTLFDIFFSMFYFFYNPYFFIPMLFAIMGYMGAKNFNINQVQCYLSFILCYNLFRVIAWFFYIYNISADNGNNLILGTLFVFICFVIELWIMRVVYRLSICLQKLSNIQLDIIKKNIYFEYKKIYW